MKITSTQIQELTKEIAVALAKAVYEKGGVSIEEAKKIGKKAAMEMVKEAATRIKAA